MKTKQLLTGAFAFVVTALLFTSCSSDKIQNFSARKYTHFKKGEATVYNNSRSEKRQSEVTENSTQKNNFSNSQSAPTVTINNNVELNSPKSENVVSNSITKSNRKNNFSIKTEAANVVIPVSTKAETTNTIRKTFTHTSSRLGNSNQIVAIICAIFIPPLGVYIHNNAINTQFWVDLILTLLFFFPGMIYALLVVTDTI